MAQLKWEPQLVVLIHGHLVSGGGKMVNTCFAKMILGFADNSGKFFWNLDLIHLIWLCVSMLFAFSLQEVCSNMSHQKPPKKTHQKNLSSFPVVLLLNF